MPKKTYLVCFFYRDDSVEIQECVHYTTAKFAFDMSSKYDADIYAEIQLIERDWRKNEDECDTILEKKVFADQFTKE